MTTRTRRPRPARRAAIGTVLLLLLSLFWFAAPGASAARHEGPKPTVVLVHGAFADGSSWSGVTTRLQGRGYTVVVPGLPLRGLTYDSAYLHSLLAQIPGPVVLVGHSYGGAVISNAATGAPNVRALVVVSGFLPEPGEVLSDVESHSTDSLLGPALVPLQYPTTTGSATATELIVDPARFPAIFGADLPAKKAAMLAATQRPTGAAAFSEASGPVAWKTVPTWSVVGTGDKAAGADVVRSMAQRAGAHLTELNGSHLVMVSQPGAVTQVILKAIRATG